MKTTHKFEVEAEAGTIDDFKSFHLIERMASGKLDDGRTFEIYRGALGHPYFEVQIEGEPANMRIDLKQMLMKAAGELGQLTAKEEAGA